MAVIIWNKVHIEVPIAKALQLFVGLLFRLDTKAAKTAASRLGRAGITIIYALNSSKEIDFEVDKAVVQYVCRFAEEFAELSGSASELSGSANNYIQGRYLDSEYVFKLMWIGHRTPGRSIDIYGDMDTGTATVNISTGTGKPSQFLAPFCTLVARQALDEVKEVFELIS